MALGINDLIIFQTLGNANTTVGIPITPEGVGTFVLDYTQASILKINETGLLGGSTMFLDAASTETLPTAHPNEPTAASRETGDQKVVGGPYDGMKVAVGNNQIIRYNASASGDPDADAADWIAGRVHEIKVDTNNDGTFDKVIGLAFERGWATSARPHENGATYYGDGAANQPDYSLNWDLVKPASELTPDKLPSDMHELRIYSSVGTADLSGFKASLGYFTLDYDLATKITIQDTGTKSLGKDKFLEANAGTAFTPGDPEHPLTGQVSPVGQKIVGGAYDGKLVAIGNNVAIRDGSNNAIVGRVTEILVDNDGDGVAETRIGYAVESSWAWTNYAIKDGREYYGTTVDGTKVGIDYRLLGDAVCFAAGTMILTENGLRAVETLTQGDMVQTADNGLQAIRWIGKQTVTARNLDLQPNLRPIRISAGALGDGLPETDLVVSPQHRVMLKSHIAQTMFGQSEILVAAKQLLAVPGFAVVEDAQGVEYWHFMMDRHEVVFANGAATESLFTGPEALKSVSRESKAEILALFPELQDIDHAAMLRRAARPIIQGRPVRDLAQKHLERNLPLVARH